MLYVWLCSETNNSYYVIYCYVGKFVTTIDYIFN